MNFKYEYIYETTQGSITDDNFTFNGGLGMIQNEVYKLKIKI